MSPGQRIARVSPSTLHREIHDETILLHLDTGEYYGLGGTATRIWQLIVEDGDLDRIEAAIIEEFDADREILSNELRSVIAELVAKQLIEVEEVA
jgi:hypothetical protein